MKKRTVRFKLTVGLLVGLVLLSLGGCDGILGSDDDSENGSGDISNGDGAVTSWILVNDSSEAHPFGGTYRVALIDKDDSQMTIIFYEETDSGVVQVAGAVLPFEISGDQFTFEWSHVWLDEDPQKEGITYSGKDWYEIPPGADAPAGGTAQLVGDTLVLTIGEDRVFDRIPFSLPEELVGTWDLNEADSTGDLKLESTSNAPVPGWGGLEYTFDTQSGSGYWQASGTTEGYFRQIYTEISDEETLEYWSHLSPYTLSDGGLKIFLDLARESPLNYTR